MPKKIVPGASASIDGFMVKTSSVPANHLSMCKFADSSDIGYQRVSGHIVSFVQAAAREVAQGEQARWVQANAAEAPAARLFTEPVVTESSNFGFRTMSASGDTNGIFEVEET